ncbi:hypothetical protein JTE90_006553 [Oedothorax gibbosus]|uniref:acid phosphatase n=1 Tax=Oedothorax gibbosus TaxID=931172 RepID=A0AAV6VKR1_9ARAC|nr:hypothetical protein JTE90_006553 [Oedothorax gibbosus]
MWMKVITLLILAAATFILAAATFTLVAARIKAAPPVVSQSTNLLLVQMLFRHGARAPVKIFPTDPNPIEVWPEGLGGLTQLGKRQHYTLGKYLRAFYFGFVTSNPNEVLVYSTSYRRCLQSALANLAAFYAPTDPRWVVEDGFDWQPVAVYYRDPAKDKYLSVNTDCPKLYKEMEKQFSSSDFKSEYGKHNNMFDALKLYGGLNSTDSYEILSFYDAVLTEKYHGLIVPEWIEPYFDELKELSDFIIYQWTNTLAQQRLLSGPFLGKMLENMDNKISGKNDHLKVHMYSAHGINVASLLNALGVYERNPPSAACVLIELHETQVGPAVRLLYLNSTTMQDIATISPVLLKLQGCGEFCPMEHFRHFVQPIIPDDWNKECHT